MQAPGLGYEGRTVRSGLLCPPGTDSECRPMHYHMPFPKTPSQSTSNQRKGQGAVRRGNANQSPKEKGGKACHLLFLFVFDIFLWSVGEERTKASLEGSLLYMLPVLSPVPAKSREGHVQLALQDANGAGRVVLLKVFALLLHLAGSQCQKKAGFRLALPTCDN